MSKIQGQTGADIRPVSALRNDNKLLAAVSPDHPIDSIQNGDGQGSDYDEFRKAKLVSKLDELVRHARNGVGRPLDEVMNELNQR